VPHDEQRAVDLFRHGCDVGEGSACFNLASLHHEGRAVPLDRPRSIVLMRASCAGFSEQVTRDYPRAAQLLEKGCDGDVALSCGALGDLYAKGLGVRQDAKRASTLWRRACAGGVTAHCGH